VNCIRSVGALGARVKARVIAGPAALIQRVTLVRSEPRGCAVQCNVVETALTAARTKGSNYQIACSPFEVPLRADRHHQILNFLS
jgi:hypothetical protein